MKSDLQRAPTGRLQKRMNESASTGLSCLVCDQIAEQVFRFLARIQYELSHNSQEQQEHARQGGFCPMHTWQYERLASPQGICTAYPNVLRAIATKMTASAEKGALDACLVRGPDRCQACQVAHTAEEEALQSLAAGVPDSAKSSLPGLCLAHLQMVVDRVGDPQVAERLLMHTAEVLGQLAERMERFNQKRERVLREPITEEDWVAPQQALALLVGHRKVQPEYGGAGRSSRKGQGR